MQEIEVWPENWPTWEVWLALSTNWRIVSGNGDIAYLGLEYPAIPEALQMVGVKKKQRGQVRIGLRVMEGAALPVLNGEDPTED